VFSEISENVLLFVQHGQVAVGICATGDAVDRAVAIWNCLAAFPMVGETSFLHRKVG
jgi:hypothetical protein